MEGSACVPHMEGASLLIGVAERALGRRVEGPAPDAERVRKLGRRFQLPTAYQNYLLLWGSEDFGRAGLRCDGAAIRLAEVGSLVELQSALDAIDPRPRGKMVIGVAEGEASPGRGRGFGPFRQAPPLPKSIWLLDVASGEVLRVDLGSEPITTHAAPSFSEFLKRIALETADALPPCHPFSSAPGGEPAFDALAAAVNRLARVVSRRIGRPPGYIRGGHSIARILAARYGLPPIYRRFLEAWSSRDFVDTGLSCKKIACWITPVDGLEHVQGAYRDNEAWPLGWVVVAVDYEGCYVLDLATCNDGDCAVLFLSHGDGLRATPVADSFVAFLDRVAEDSEPGPGEAWGEEGEDEASEQGFDFAPRRVPPPGFGVRAKAPEPRVKVAELPAEKQGSGRLVLLLAAALLLSLVVFAARCAQ